MKLLKELTFVLVVECIYRQQEHRMHFWSPSHSRSFLQEISACFESESVRHSVVVVFVVSRWLVFTGFSLLELLVWLGLSSVVE